MLREANDPGLVSARTSVARRPIPGEARLQALTVVNHRYLAVGAPSSPGAWPLWLTILCGIGGVLIGYYLAAALGVEATRGIDWIRWIISIIVAAILVMIAASVTGRRSRTI